jgi:hypothetical protein
LSFQIQGNNIYYASRDKNDAFLNRRTVVNSEIGQPERIKLPDLLEYSLQLNAQSPLLLTDNDNNLYLIDAAAFSNLAKADFNMADYLIFQDKAKKVSWSANGNLLIYFTDFEIYTFDLNSRRKNLITRYSRVIKDAIWYPGNKYLLYQVGDAIHASEICCSESRNDIQLADKAEDNNLIMDAAGQYLYFDAKIGSQEGLYKLQLQ